MKKDIIGSDYIELIKDKHCDTNELNKKMEKEDLGVCEECGIIQEIKNIIQENMHYPICDSCLSSM